ncbi:MAG: hypothetical protein EBU88_10465 [Acidobacteria bacterium]|nr:hypothetical protein [Acidobacteriota bacterium]
MPPSQPGPQRRRSCPQGVARSDWQGILVAHEEWKHTIREAPDGAQGWQAENTGSGLRATFDGHGGVVRPAGGDWHWGLELEGYGIGAERRLVAARTPRVGTNGRRIGYDWDGNLEEWYQNRAAGLEHSYTIRERLGRPGEEAPLELWLKVRGELAAVAVDDDGRGASFGRERGQALLRYAGLKVWDAEGREVAARLETEGSGELRLVVEEQTASYPLTIDPTITAQQAYLKASNTEVQDFFGYSVTISGETVVVGAPYESSNAIGVNGDQLNNLASYSGAAYVFVRNGLTWTQQAYLKASNTQSREDCFGWSVGISGETIVVGAPQESRNISGVNGNVQGNTPLWASSSGAAYIFVRNGSNWIQQAYLKASNTRAGDKFGTSVAISGETVVVGSPYEDSDATGVNGNQLGTSASDSGAAYVFFRNGAIWSQQAYLKASNTEANDWFGYSVATSGKTVLVGAWAEDSYAKGIDGDQSDNSASDSGAAYIFVRDDINWNQQAYLKASNAEPWNRFGWSVALSGERVVIGAHGESNAVTGVNGDQSGNASRLAQWSGAAYVFLRNGTMWTQEAYLKASNTSVSASFGFSVAISGERLVVGSHLQSSLAWVSGAAYVFVHNGTSWFEQAFIKASNPDSQDYFGRAVAVSGDTVLVGAAEDDSNATGINGDQFDNSAENSGAAYVFQAKALSIANQPIAGVSGGVLLTQPVIVIRD